MQDFPTFLHETLKAKHGIDTETAKGRRAALKLLNLSRTGLWLWACGQGLPDDRGDGAAIVRLAKTLKVTAKAVQQAIDLSRAVRLPEARSHALAVISRMVHEMTTDQLFGSGIGPLHPATGEVLALERSRLAKRIQGMRVGR